MERYKLRGTARAELDAEKRSDGLPEYCTADGTRTRATGGDERARTEDA